MYFFQNMKSKSLTLASVNSYTHRHTGCTDSVIVVTQDINLHAELRSE